MEQYAEAVTEVGLPQLKPIFDRVLALAPDELHKPENEKALSDHLYGRFEELKQLAHDSYDASADSPATVAPAP